jgi:hypothetical protein
MHLCIRALLVDRLLLGGDLVTPAQGPHNVREAAVVRRRRL